MRVLIVKTSSMGDVIHTLPALTDAGHAHPDIQFDWVVEENFVEIPGWHPLVKRIIPVALRRWRKAILSSTTRAEWSRFRNELQQTDYDLIIDAQGLVKSAIVTLAAKGLRSGPDIKSAREPLAALFYQRKYRVDQNQHAVTRMRKLFAQALHYELPDVVADYGVNRKHFVNPEKSSARYLVFLHGTTWPTKHWPENYWIELARLANQDGFVVKLPWGNSAEQERAKRIAAVGKHVEVLPRLDLRGMAGILAGAQAIVAVDTGLGHLAAALDVPTISLYGPTNPELTGALGRSQIHLAAKFSCAPCLSRECIFKNASSYPEQPPCFTSLPPELVWAAVNSSRDRQGVSP